MSPEWKVGMMVEVQPRTWAGINRPGGHGQIMKIHYQGDSIEAIDVKYTLWGGWDNGLDPDLLRPYQELDRGGRSRRQARHFTIQSKPSPSVQKHHTEKENTSCQRRLMQDHTTVPIRNKKKKARTANTTKSSKKSTKPSTSEAVPIGEVIVSSGEEGTLFSPLQDGGVESNIQRQYMLHQQATKQTLDCSQSSISNSHFLSDNDDDTSVAGKEPMENSLQRHVQVSACSPSLDMPARATLWDVYEKQVKDAAKFVEQVVNHHPSSTDWPKVDQTISSGPKNDGAFDNARQSRFIYLLQELLQEKDGLADEDEVAEKMTGLKDPFTDTEIEEYLAVLCERNAIMRSNGIVVNI